MDAHEFGGVIGRYAGESQPWWPEPVRARAGAPNVVFVLLDDVGFAQLGCFGSAIDTPNLDALAHGGLRYTNFHTTALCSPTRSCVLTGRNHHANSMGRITDLAMGFPGYTSRIPRTNGFLPEILVPHGYAAWAIGKWHLTPDDECHLAASRARWPLGRGFERWYGFFGGETHQFGPTLWHDNHQVPPPRAPEDGYHLTEDLVDHAIEFLHDLRAVDADKPFFLYCCPGACHSPHQAPPAWIERYRGRFDRGWDVARAETFARQRAMGLLPETTELSPRPSWVPAWDDLDPDAQRVYARYMEAFAGFLSHADHEIGRLVGALAATGDLDNTVFVVMSDNGASSEGGPVGSVNDARPWNMAPRTVEEALARLDEIGGPNIHNNYPWGWTIAGNAPFRRWKREVHEGGVADPCIVHWPAGIRARGELRDQYVHAIDLVPTVLDVVGIAPPTTIDGYEQRAFDGASFATSFADAAAPSARRTQYYEMFGCRAIYHDGWKAVTYHPIQATEPGLADAAWELYDVRVDRSECHDLAAREPERLRELVELWWREAERNQVLPIDNRAFSEFVLDRPHSVPARSRYVYYPHRAVVLEDAAVNVRNRAHRVTAEIDVADAPVEGVLLAMGSVLGGYTFFVLDGRLVYVHNYVGLETHRVDAPLALAPGAHTLAFQFDKTGEHRGTVTLLVDDAEVGAGEIPRFTPMRFSITDGGLTCGYDPAMAVVADYRAPFRFTGTLHRVVVDVDGPEHHDPETDVHVAIARQ
ncbi:MAG TPA: arylsulfatase [Acidimicrobiia bacterium]|nr:arylsulfatase [Acidimicrobiia bacterium]